MHVCKVFWVHQSRKAPLWCNIWTSEWGDHEPCRWHLVSELTSLVGMVGAILWPVPPDSSLLPKAGRCWLQVFFSVVPSTQHAFSYLFLCLIYFMLLFPHISETSWGGVDSILCVKLGENAGRFMRPRGSSMGESIEQTLSLSKILYINVT